jgi:TP901 family phage tail tape measure protein
MSASAFNLTAQINLQGPSNLRTVVADIRRQIGSIRVDIDPQISATAARNIAQLNNRLNTLTTTLNNVSRAARDTAGSIDILARAANSLGVRSVQQNVTNIARSTQTLGNQATTAAQSLNNAGDAMNNFGRQAALAVRRFAAFSIVTNIIFGFIGAINKGVKAFIDFDREFVRLQQVTGENAQGLQSLSRTITSLSTTLGVASAELTTVSVTLAQAGFSASDTEKALGALAKSALAPTFKDLNNTVEGSIALLRQFSIGSGELEAALGSINAVAAKFAVEADDIIGAIQRTGGVFANASRGVSQGTQALNEFIAIFTSVRATTRESAETIATGLRTIFTRIQRTDTIDALKDFGITLTDLEGKFVGPFEAIRRLSEGLKSIDPRDLRFSKIVEELGGFRQIGKVIPLIQQFATAQEALKVAQRGQGSLSEDAATAQASIAVQLTKVREEFTALIRSIGESESFRSFVKLSLDLATALIRLADAAKVVLPALTAIAAFKGISAITRFGAGFTSAIRPTAPTGFATGGLVPGSGNTDSVDARLTPGEYVLRKKAVEEIGVENLARLNRGGVVQKFKNGGIAKAPLVDDIANASGTIMPRPGSAIAALIRAGGGAIDIDRTIKRTIGDKAYATAKTPQAQSSVLSKYFNDNQARLSDIQSAPMTQFGTELQSAIKAGQLNPSRLSIISKSRRAPGVAEYLNKLFGIPVSNMVFTQGESKQPAMDAIRSKGPRSARVAQKFAQGGLVVEQLDSTQFAGLFARPQGPDSSGKPISVASNKKTSTGKEILGTIGSPSSYFISGVDENTFTQDASNRLTGAIDSISQSLGGPAVTEDSIKEQLVNSIGVKDIAGKIFEGVTRVIAGSFSGKEGDTFDIPKGTVTNTGALSKLFNAGNELPNIDYDAKLSENPKNRSSLLNKAISAGIKTDTVPLVDFADSSTTSQLITKLKGKRDAQSASIAKKRIAELEQAKTTAQQIFPADDGALSLIIKRLSTSQNALSDASKQNVQAANNGGLIQKFAMGGSVSSEDTVKALLTPGEYVLNKETANKLGRNTLDKLNNADKIQGFNKGGPVGHVQKFNVGGAVGTLSKDIELSTKDVALVNSAAKQAGEAFETLAKDIEFFDPSDAAAAVKAFARAINSGADSAVALQRAGEAALSSATGARSSGPAQAQTRLDRDTRDFERRADKTDRTAQEGFGKKSATEQAAILASSISPVGKAETRQDDLAAAQFSVAGDAVVRATAVLDQFGAESKAAQKGLLVFTTTLRSTGDEQAALSAATAAATAVREQEAVAVRKTIQAQQKTTSGLSSFLPTSLGFAKAGKQATQAFGALKQLKGLGIGGLIAGGAAISSASTSLGGPETNLGAGVGALGSALNFGTIGAQIGTSIAPLLGPFGALAPLVGGAVGALGGFVSGLYDARRAFEEIKKERAKVAVEKQTQLTATSVDAFIKTPSDTTRSSAIASIGELGAKEQERRFLQPGATVKEIASLEAAGADQAKKVLFSEMERTGQTFQQLSKSLSVTELKTLKDNIAQADEEYISEQLFYAKRIRELQASGASPGQIEAVEKERINALNKATDNAVKRATVEGEAAAALKRAADKQKALAIAIDKAILSVQRTFSTVDQVLNRVAFEISEAGAQREAILSGSADLGGQEISKAINILQNPQAFTQEERQGATSLATPSLGGVGSFIGEFSSFAERATDAATVAFDKVGRSRVFNDPGERRAAEFTEVGETLKDQVAQTFGDTGLALGLQENIQAAIDDAIKEGKNLSLDELVSKALGGLGEESKKAQELLIKSLELTNQAFSEVAETAKAYADLQNNIINRSAELTTLQATSRLQTTEALGIRTTPQQKLEARMSGSAQRLGFGSGADVNTANILARRQSLLGTQSSLSGNLGQLRGQGSSASGDAIIQTSTSLANVNNALARTEEELKNLPQNLESAINDVIGEIQKRVSFLDQRKQAGAGFAEKLVTSTPKELSELNRTYSLLQNTLRGNITTVNESRSAQRAYFEAVRSGKTQQEAAGNAQQAFAEENKKALSLFDELSKVSGVQGQEFDLMRADLIENFAKATGQQDNQFIKAALSQLREDPEARAQRDPVLVALQRQAESLRDEQVRAVEAANAIDRDKQAQLLDSVAQVIIQRFEAVASLIDTALARVEEATARGVVTGPSAGRSSAPGQPARGGGAPAPAGQAQRQSQSQSQQQTSATNQQTNAVVGATTQQTNAVVGATTQNTNAVNQGTNSVVRAVSSIPPGGSQTTNNTTNNVNVEQRPGDALGGLLPRGANLGPVQELAEIRATLARLAGERRDAGRQDALPGGARLGQRPLVPRGGRVLRQQQQARDRGNQLLVAEDLSREEDPERRRQIILDAGKDARGRRDAQEKERRRLAFRERQRTPEQIAAERQRQREIAAANAAGLNPAVLGRDEEGFRQPRPPGVPQGVPPGARAAGPVAGAQQPQPQQPQQAQQPPAIPQEAVAFVNNFTQELGKFGQYVDKLANIKIPNQLDVKVTSDPIEVRIVGDAALASMGEGIQSMIASQVNDRLREIWNQTGGEVGQA